VASFEKDRAAPGGVVTPVKGLASQRGIAFSGIEEKK
jgi:hypothetical protein